jgi:hypothetical protein
MNAILSTNDDGTTLEQENPATISFVFALVGDIEFASKPRCNAGVAGNREVEVART